jgi:hypothetical protein
MSHADNSTPVSGDPYEKKDVKMLWIVIATGVCVVAVVVSVVLLDFYFDFYRDKLHQEMVVDRGHLLANEAESATEKSLSGDGEKTISIDEAMKAIEDK